MDQKRLQYLDIAKGIAIICVVLGHLGSFTINRVVFTFHIPIFYIITGFCMNDRLAVRDFIKNRARRLLMPYLYTCIVIIVLATLRDGVFFGADGARNAMINWIYAAVYGAGDSYTEPFYIKGIGAIWFLWASFWGSCFLRALLDVDEKPRIMLTALLFLAGYCTGNLFWFPLNIQAGCYAVLFMYLGYLVRRAQEPLRQLPSEIKIVWLAFAFWVSASFIRNFQSFWLVHCDIGRGVTDVVGCICACCLVLWISRNIEKRFQWLANVLSTAGRHSLVILCVHMVELDLIPWWRMTELLVERGMPSEMQIWQIIIGKAILIGGASAAVVWAEKWKVNTWIRPRRL